MLACFNQEKVFFCIINSMLISNKNKQFFKKKTNCLNFFFRIRKSFIRNKVHMEFVFVLEASSIKRTGRKFSAL